MKIKDPLPQPKRTTVELTRKEVEEALRDYIVKHSPTCIPEGKVTVVILDPTAVAGCKRITDKDIISFVIEEPVE